MLYLKYAMFSLILALCAGGLTSCRSGEPLAVGVAFYLTEPVFLMTTEDGLHGHRLALSPAPAKDRSHYLSVPTSIEDYLAGKEQDKGVVGVVTKGTKVVKLRMICKKALSPLSGKIVEDCITFGEIASGPFSGKVVDLADVFDWPQKQLSPIKPR